MHHLTPERVVIVVLLALFLGGYLIRCYHKAAKRAFKEEFGFLPNDWEPLEVQQSRIDTRLGHYQSEDARLQMDIRALVEQLHTRRAEYHDVLRGRVRAERMAQRRGFIVA